MNAHPPSHRTDDHWHAAPLDVVTIGHAIVDVLGHADDALLGHHRLVKGSMELVDEERAVPLYGDMAARALHRGDDLLQLSGGSAANTAVVAAMLGARSAFIGKVRDDELGHTFARDLHEVGVRFSTPMSHAETTPTGRCLINVTPDAERTMCTFLGAARGLRVPDMDEALLTGAKVTYVEGYLWDEVNAHEALLHAIHRLHVSGRRFSFTLSDSFLVDRFRDEFHRLIPESVDILFANEHELCSLFETDDLDDAVRRIQPLCEITSVTRGPKGSLVVHRDGVIEVPAHPVEQVIDTTGAGDAYAGGFLHAFTQGHDLRRCGVIGNIAAAEVISHMGARPSEGLSGLVLGG